MRGSSPRTVMSKAPSPTMPTSFITKSWPTGPCPTTTTRRPLSLTRAGGSFETAGAASTLPAGAVTSFATAKADCKPCEGLVGNAVMRASSTFSAFTSSSSALTLASSAPFGSGPKGPRHHSGLMYSWIHSFLWIADQNLVASFPAQSRITCSPPGWSWRKPVRSYTLPCSTTQADSLVVCFFTSLMGTPAAPDAPELELLLSRGLPLLHRPPFENSKSVLPLDFIHATSGKPPI
mmetsp:Transcript_95417/g.221459  ORF Transcript_95417/g.221459 Transcript_95417/m.221459 type:complete len:235 (-) Transcript_95417:252-956(-)